MVKNIIRGDVIYADLGQHTNSCVQSGIRPCVVVSNDKNNKYANSLSVCPCTTKIDKKQIPTHILIQPSDVKGYFERKSVLLAEQITVIGKNMIVSKVGHISEESDVMKAVNGALKRQLDV